MRSALEELDELIEAARASRDTPLLSGPHLVLWGALIAAAMATTWAVLTTRLAEQPRLIGAAWLACLVVGIVGSLGLNRVRRQKPGRQAAANVAARRIFIAAGVAVWAFALGVTARNGFWPAITEASAEPMLYDLIIPVGLLVYSVVFCALGAVSRQRWLYAPACAAGVCAVATLFVIGDPIIYLVGAFGLLLTLVLPGVVLTKRQPRSLHGLESDG